MLYYLGTQERATKYRGVEQMVARRAHNPEVAGSSPVPATTKRALKRKDFNALFFLLLEKNAGLSVGGPLTYCPLLFLDKHERSYWVEVS